MNELDAIRAQLAAHQQQIADAQQRLTALEQTPPSTARDGSLAELVALGVKLASSVARAAADAGGQGGVRPAPAGGTPSPLRDRIRRAQAAAHAATEATAQVRQAPVDEPTPPKSMFPITEDQSGLRPAAPFAGRTAPRRTLPPEAPVRLWNQDHTDHVDATARSTMTPGVTRLLVTRGAEDALAWLRELDGGTFAAWLDREWVVAAWTYTPRLRSGDLTLDLLPIPKPPRVDQVLGRGITVPDVAPYRIPADLAKGDRIGVEHPDGTITTHEFSGDPAHPVAEPDPHKAMERNVRALYKIRDEVAEPVGTVTSGLIHARPSDHPEGPCCGRDEHGCHELGCTRRARDVDEVLPMPGGPNDKLSQAASRPEALRLHVADGGFAETTNITEHEIDHLSGGRFAYVRFADANAQLFLRHRRDTVRVDWAGRTWTVVNYALHSTRDTSVSLGPLPGAPGEPGAPDAKPTGYGDLYARLPYLHDAVAEEES